MGQLLQYALLQLHPTAWALLLAWWLRRLLVLLLLRLGIWVLMLQRRLLHLLRCQGAWLLLPHLLMVGLQVVEV
jgi:hypothetical protein